MKKIQKKILAVILSAIVAFSMPTALAVDAYYNLPLDVGNHHRYSGGSRSRSRSRSNSRSRSRSYSSSGRSSSSSGSSEIDEKTAIILVIAFLVIFVSVFGLIIWCVKQPDKKSKKYKNIPPMFPYNATEQITEFIKQNDENNSCYGLRTSLLLFRPLGLSVIGRKSVLSKRKNFLNNITHSCKNISALAE